MKSHGIILLKMMNYVLGSEDNLSRYNEKFWDDNGYVEIFYNMEFTDTVFWLVVRKS